MNPIVELQSLLMVVPPNPNAELVNGSVVNRSDDSVAKDSVGGMDLAVDAKILCLLTVGFGDLRGSGTVAVDQIWWWRARRNARYRR